MKNVGKGPVVVEDVKEILGVEGREPVNGRVHEDQGNGVPLYEVGEQGLYSRLHAAARTTEVIRV